MERLPISNWYTNEPIIPPQQAASTKPWDELPWRWNEFAPLTMVASGGKYVPFQPYGFQENLVRAIRKYQNVYVLKSRQTGISETIISYMLSNSIRRKAWTGVCFSKTGEDASELAARIKGQASTLREKCPPLPKDSMRKLVFGGAGSLHFLPPTERAARGIPSASFLLFDEAAFIDKLRGIETGALPTTSMLGDRARHVWCSTPNGRSGAFAEHWFEDHGEEVIDPTPMGPHGWPRVRASPDGQFAKIAIHYSEHPIYGLDPDWAEKTRRKRQLTQQQWNQEYELDFAASDRQLYAHDLIELAEQQGGWELPRRQGYYVMGIDPNGGGADDFCAVVVDVSRAPWRVVAGYADSGRTRDYSLQHCAMLIDQYAPAMVCVEKNGVGAAMAESLLILRPGTEVEECSTTETMKVMITDRLALLLEQQEITIPPDPFPGQSEPSSVGDQLRNFRVAADGKRAAASGWKDDAVMALAWACQAGAMKRPMTSSWITMA